MVQPRLFKYTVVVMTADGGQEDITQFLSGLTWEEEEDQLPVRIVINAKNDSTSRGRISSIAVPGCWVGVLYSYNGGGVQEACRGKIIEWAPSARLNADAIQLKAYDCLYDLNESQDNIYYKRGKRTYSIISKILRKWGVPISAYAGPNVKHSKIVYKAEKIGTAILKILDDAKNRGGNTCYLRSEGMTVQILTYGNNAEVYHFDDTSDITNVKHSITTAGMVTRVRVTGQKKKSGKVPVKATLNGQVQYGIRQKLVSKSKNEKLKTAKKEAKRILADEGHPKETIQFTVPDIPSVRRGHKVHVQAATIAEGYYYVVGCSHSAATQTMTLTVKQNP